MSRVALLFVLLALVITLSGAGGAAALPLGGPSKTTPNDLPVVKLPDDPAQVLPAPSDNPQADTATTRPAPSSRIAQRLAR